MSTRKWFIARALESFKSLTTVLSELTEDEVLACLELEAASQRRLSVIDRLISRASRLRELCYSNFLKEKYHGTPQANQEPDPHREQGPQG
jgi:hypothetical protein